MVQVNGTWPCDQDATIGLAVEEVPPAQKSPKIEPGGDALVDLPS
jgi:hypothetical protein